MACACKTNRDLTYLQRNFGFEKKTTVSEEVGFTIGEMGRRILTFVLALLSVPFFLFYIIYNGMIRKKCLNIGKIFRINGKQQQ